jgi:GDP-L-fucose synthase
MAKRILVLGGHGFMGKNIQEEFTNSEHKMFYRSRRDGTDMTDFVSLINTLEEINPDIIIHAAAHVGSIAYVSKYCADVVHDNTQMYITLYQAVAAHNKDIVVINPISNCSYPGIIDIQNEENWWDGPIHESVESYGTPKKMGFIISQCYARQYGIKTLNLIVPNAYGPNDYIDEERTHAMNGIIMRMIKSKRNSDKEFVVWGTGSPIREWIYMPDMARIMKEIINKEQFDLPNPINIGQEDGISILNSVKTVKAMLGYDVEITNDTTKQDGAPIKVLGNSIFREHFPDFKFTGYEEGITNTINYYNKHIK